MVEILDAHPLLKKKDEQNDPSIPPQARQEFFYHRASMFQFKELKQEAERWCQRLPVLGFNSASFDINLVREYLLPVLANAVDEEGNPEHSPNCIKKNNAYTSMSTKKMQFLDMMQYLAAGSSYENFVKGYAPTVKLAKAPFPYKWLNSTARLEEGLPERHHFYNDLKNEELSEEDYERVKQLWFDNSIITMAQYLEFYNKLDVTGFVVAAENYKKWWHNENIDAFKQGMCIFFTNLLVLCCRL